MPTHPRIPPSLLASLVLCLCLLGCGDDTAFPLVAGGDLDPAPAAVALGVQGWVDMQPAPAIVGAPAATPAVAAEVRAYALDDELLQTTTTDAEGFFALDVIGAGATRVEVRVAPGSASPDATAWVTLYPDAAIVAGQEPAISRERAAAIASDGVLPSTLVVGSMQPLVAGTRVEDPLADPANPSSRVLDADAWLLLVDPDPLASWGHTVEYVLVDAATGAMTSIPAEGPPFVNGALLWSSDIDLFAFEGIEALEDDDALVLPESFPRTPSPELVQVPRSSAPVPLAAEQPTLPPVQALATGAPGIGALHNEEPASVFVLIVQGDPGLAGALDRWRMRHFFLTTGVLPSNICIARGNIWPNYRRCFDRLEARMAERLRRGEHSTLVCVISTRWGVDKRKLLLKTRLGRTSSPLPLSAAALRLHQTSACRVRVIIEAGQAQLFGQEVALQFIRTPRSERPDLVVYSSAKAQEHGFVGDYLSMEEETLPRDAGSLFLNAALEHMGVTLGDITGLRDYADPRRMRDELRELRHTYYGYQSVQHPTVDVRVNVPARCAEPEPPTGGIPSGKSVGLSASPTGVSADGTSVIRLTATVTHAVTGARIAGEQVTFSSTVGTILPAAPLVDEDLQKPGIQVSTDGSGVAEAEVRAPLSHVDVRGDATASIEGTMATMPVTFRGFAPSVIVVSHPEEIPADGMSTTDIGILIQWLVALLPHEDVTVTTDRGTLLFPQGRRTDAMGELVVELQSVESATTVVATVTARIAGGAMGSTMVTFAAQAGDCSLTGDYDCTFVVDSDPCSHDPVLMLRDAMVTISGGLGQVSIAGSDPSTIAGTGTTPDCTTLPSAVGQGTVAGVSGVEVEYFGIEQPTPDTIAGQVGLGIGGALPGGCPIFYSFTGTRRSP